MVNKIADIALEAGQIIKNNIMNNKHVSLKGRIDLVTEFDVMVENLLKEKLSRLFPYHKIVGEESFSAFPEKNENAIYIDPIDGTTNFVHGFPFVSVSIGVYTGGEGQYGVVYNPILNELYTASKGNGAYFNGNKIYVSNTPSLEQSLCATGFPYNQNNLPFLMSALEKVLKITRGIRRAGSAALDLCHVAKGVFDVYYETNLKAWDIAAGVIIVKEAGGNVTDLNGDSLDILKGSVLSSNGILHEEFIKLISEIK